MTGTCESLGAKIRVLIKSGAANRRILQTMLPLFLTVPRRCNFTQFCSWTSFNEGALHNWFKRDLGLASFNAGLVEGCGSGNCVVLDTQQLPLVKQDDKELIYAGRFSWASLLLVDENLPEGDVVFDVSEIHWSNIRVKICK